MEAARCLNLSVKLKVYKNWYYPEFTTDQIPYKNWYYPEFTTGQIPAVVYFLGEEEEELIYT